MKWTGDPPSSRAATMTRQPRRAPRILVVDDDPGLLRLLTIRLRSQKYEVEPTDSAANALLAVARFRPDLVITDLRMAQMDGIALLRELQRRWPSLNVIMLTAHGTIPDAVKATQSGAFAFLTKPVEKEELLAEVRRALKTSGFADGDADDWRTLFATRSPILEDRLARAHVGADADTPILITGEAGTGKDLLARAVHKASSRRDGEFVAVDCGSLDPGRGDADLSRAFAAAAGGSIYLRNVDDLPATLHAALERLLDGGDVRVLASSERRVEDLAADDRFADELLDRLAVLPIDLPPLSRRREDVPLLVQQCLDEVAAESGQPHRTCSPEAMELLVSSRWPGNVRQLRMVVREIASTGAGPVITPEQVQEARGQTPSLQSFDEARDEFTRSYLVQLLQITEGNVSHAARLAKRNRTDFYKLLARYEIEPERFKS